MFDRRHVREGVGTPCGERPVETLAGAQLRAAWSSRDRGLGKRSILGRPKISLCPRQFYLLDPG